jgi:hypothetical protein
MPLLTRMTAIAAATCSKASETKRFVAVAASRPTIGARLVTIAAAPPKLRFEILVLPPPGHAVAPWHRCAREQVGCSMRRRDPSMPPERR